MKCQVCSLSEINMLYSSKKPMMGMHLALFIGIRVSFPFTRFQLTEAAETPSLKKAEAGNPSNKI